MVYANSEELYKLFLSAKKNVCTDTRKIEKGALFFSLKGDNFDANSFAEKAISLGCSAAVVDDPKFVTKANIILVEDALKSLQNLAKWHRQKLKIPFLAITGSNGKTTNKELIHAVLSKKYKTLSTKGNLNNHIGVPLTILSIKDEHEFAVIEMGANHQREIEFLCNIALPDYGLITNIGKAHLEGFGGIEGVKKGKSELYVFLRKHLGKAFVNADDEVLNTLAFENDKITFGCKKLYDVIGKNYSDSSNVKFKYTTRYGEKNFSLLPEIQTQIVGSYNFINCLAAVCVGNYFKVEDRFIKEALEEYTPDMNRSQLINTAKNTLILDAYNANPTSMKAAIDSFAASNNENKLLLLGDMYELGEYTKEEHQKIINCLLEHQLSNCILVGEHFSKTINNDFPKFLTTDDCKNYLKKLDIKGSSILIKGSRAMKMETLQEVL